VGLIEGAEAIQTAATVSTLWGFLKPTPPPQMQPALASGPPTLSVVRPKV